MGRVGQGVEKLTMRFAAIAASVLLSSCTAQPEAAAQPVAAEATSIHPESGLEVIPLTVSYNGGEHEFRVEVAKTAAEQARGLMFRTALGENEGMLFPRDPPGFASFWMKNTVIPLDIIFVGTDGRITNIAAMTTPYSLDSIPSDGVAAAVLEIRGGRAAELGIVSGARVEW